MDSEFECVAKGKLWKMQTIKVKYSDFVAVSVLPFNNELTSPNCSNKREQKRDSQKTLRTEEKATQKKNCFAFCTVLRVEC